MHNLILKRFQSIRRARREVAGVTFCARTFQKPAHYFCYCPTGPSRRAGREAPPRGCLLYGATLERLCDCVLACRVVSRGHVPLYAIVAVHVVATSCPGRRARRGRGRDVAAWFFVASCGCDTPMNASASNGFDGVSLSRFAQQICCVYSESHQANDNERNGDEETTTKATTQGR